MEFCHDEPKSTDLVHRNFYTLVTYFSLLYHPVYETLVQPKVSHRPCGPLASMTIPTRRRVATVLLCVGDWCPQGFDQFAAAAAAADAAAADDDDDDPVMIVDG